MPIVQLENGEKLQFDDNLNDEQIGQAVDEYLAGDVKPIENQPVQQPKQEGFQEANRRRFGEFARGIPQGLGNIGIGTVQALTDLGEAGARKVEKAIYGDNMNAQTFGNRLADQVKQRNAQQSQLPISERAGIFAGETAPFLTVGGGITAKIGSLPFKGSRALGLAVGSGAGGATMGATSMQDKAGLDNRLEQTGKDAAISAITGGALGLIGGGASKFVGKPRTAEEIKQVSQLAYKEAANKGGVLQENFTNKFLNKAKQITPQTEAGKLLAGDDPTTKIVQRLESLKDRKISLSEAQEIDEFLGDTVDSLSNNGIMTKQGKKVLQLQTDFRNMIDNASEEDIISKSDKAKDLSKKISDSLKEYEKLKNLEDNLIRNIRGNAKAASFVGSSPAYSKEYQSLKNLEEDLIASTKGNSIVAGAINQDANKKLGFWRNRARKNSSEFINEAANDARSLQNVKKQIAAESANLKPSNSQFLSNSADDARNLANVKKQIANHENELKNLQKQYSSVAESDLITGREGFNSLKEARKLWSQAAKLRDIEKIITRAEMSDNPATAIKTGFRTLYNNPARMRGFTADEKKLIKSAAESGIITDSLRTMGSRLIPIGSAISGGGLTGTVAAQAATMASRGAAAKIQLMKAQKIADAIATRELKIPKNIGNKETLKRALSLSAANSSGGISDASAAEPTLEDAKQFIRDKYKKEAPWYTPSPKEEEYMARKALQIKMIKN